MQHNLIVNRHFPIFGQPVFMNKFSNSEELTQLICAIIPDEMWITYIL